ncbi:MAG: hypothetical protein ACLR23_05690 [Clostridia bacterium]
MADSVKQLAAMPPIPKTRLVSQTADINIRYEGVTHTEREMRATDIQEEYAFCRICWRLSARRLLLTEATVLRILEESGRGKDFVRNPQLFMEQFIEIVKNNRYRLAIDSIRYVRLDGAEYCAQEIFNAEELMANLDKTP